MAEEMLDAILAEMRAGVCTGPADALAWVSAKLKSYADRIEAAAKRTAGNAAEMRGALVTILDALKDRERDGLTEPRDILERRIVEQALAAPARNCERFQTGKEAWLAFDDEVPIWCQDHSRKGSGCNSREVADCGICVAEWLLAPAEKGGAE